jgi:hypothetical protein
MLTISKEVFLMISRGHDSGISSWCGGAPHHPFHKRLTAEHRGSKPPPSYDYLYVDRQYLEGPSA